MIPPRNVTFPPWYGTLNNKTFFNLSKRKHRIVIVELCRYFSNNKNIKVLVSFKKKIYLPSPQRQISYLCLFTHLYYWFNLWLVQSTSNTKILFSYELRLMRIHVRLLLLTLDLKKYKQNDNPPSISKGG